MDTDIVKRKFLHENGISISHLDSEQGEPFVMLHGLMSNAWDYWFQFKEFAATHRCLAPDMRGCGLTKAADPAQVTLDDAVSDALAFIQTVAPGHKQVTLMGHSFGAIVALELLARAPKQLKKVILVAAPTEMSANPLLKIALPLYRRVKFLLNKRVIRFYSLNINVKSGNVTPELKQALCKRNRYLSRSDATAMGAYFLSMHDWRMPPDFSAAAEIPVLTIFGSDDILVSEKSLTLLQRAIPHAQFETVKNARHSPMYEQPYEFNQLLSDFLDFQND